MTAVVVNDASCLIDLRKGRLLHVLLKLPYRFLVPLPIRSFELLDFTLQEWQMLDDAGLETFDLPAGRMSDVFALRKRHGRLSANDCFALVTTQCHEDAVLLTGDGLLRRVATDEGLTVHGLLWVIEELRDSEACQESLLVAALETWRADASVFLPDHLIDGCLQRFR